jgi:transposase
MNTGLSRSEISTGCCCNPWIGVEEAPRTRWSAVDRDPVGEQPQSAPGPRELSSGLLVKTIAKVALTVLASIGDISRLPSPDKLSSYFGLTPRVRQLGDQPARHGRISKQGNTATRKMLLEAAWSAKIAPGPLRAFFVRIHKKRGAQTAAVATARKLAVMIWHVLADVKKYAFARPAFTAMKLRKVALRDAPTRVRQGRTRARLLD